MTASDDGSVGGAGPCPGSGPVAARAAVARRRLRVGGDSEAGPSLGPGSAQAWASGPPRSVTRGGPPPRPRLLDSTFLATQTPGTRFRFPQCSLYHSGPAASDAARMHLTVTYQYDLEFQFEGASARTSTHTRTQDAGQQRPSHPPLPLLFLPLSASPAHYPPS